MKKIKSYAFWFNLLSAVTLLASLAGQIFGFKLVDLPAANELIAAVCGFMLLIGVVVKDDDPPAGGEEGGAGGETQIRPDR
ncbi:hypothetical protein FACS1894211_04320 [Clostridia bacterium]|nr:hypothetical protein FACS1894211_04320 [Clostridia bacterium]